MITRDTVFACLSFYRVFSQTVSAGYGAHRSCTRLYHLHWSMLYIGVRIQQYELYNLRSESPAAHTHVARLQVLREGQLAPDRGGLHELGLRALYL